MATADIELPKYNPSLQEACEKKHDTATSNKIFYLEGLRGLSCIAVVNHHWLNMLGHDCIPGDDYSTWKTNSPWHFIFDGTFHVFIFFAISGRILAESFLRKGKFETLISSMIRRPFRLCIPIFAALSFCWFLRRIDYLSLVGFHKNMDGICFDGYPADTHKGALLPMRDSTLAQELLEVFELGAMQRNNIDYQAGALWVYYFFVEVLINFLVHFCRIVGLVYCLFIGNPYLSSSKVANYSITCNFRSFL